MTSNSCDDAGEEKKEEHGASPITMSDITGNRPEKPVMPSRIHNPNPSSGSKFGSFVLSLLSFSAHSILFLCFLALAAAYCMQSIHDDYFVPVVERARRTDDDLLEEFTYYQRECSAMDVTAGVEDAQDLFIRPDSKNYGVDQMMTHGSVLFPDLLSPETVGELRKFIVAKNAIVKGTPAEYPMSQGYQRVSYGIEATEDPSVVRALKEIHDNNELKQLLEGLLGENPALTEITAITASYGCKAQVWHPDVKPDGNGVMFGRTYSHSYSLFMPLQDTTGEMGATDLCPGTHYCAGMNLHKLCEEESIGMHQVSGQGYWPAGSAALFNQQVWHRGAKHNAEGAPDRVVFIVSFLARPNDTRQLSRGTYFHMKWNMWGHTWADLVDAMKFMSWPWNVFTCLHIWRPASNGWGYDLITSAAMRIGNNQLGCEPEDLENFLSVLDKAGFPEWLDGTIDMRSNDAWEVYIRETIANILQFATKTNIYAIAAFLFILLLVTIVQFMRRKPALCVLWGGTKGVLISHGLVVALAAYLLGYVRQQPYAKDITEGRMLMRPFPPVNSTLVADPAVPDGPTTLPNRRDVLFGGRLDAKTIGAYNRWLEFHPGNQLFLNSLEEYGGSKLYRSYFNHLPPVFARAFVDAVLEPILSIGGRILQQDYRTGDWLYPRKRSRDKMIQKEIFVGERGPLALLRKEYQFILGEARFGLKRETSMALISLGFLHSLESQLFDRFVIKDTIMVNVASSRPPPSAKYIYRTVTRIPPAFSATSFSTKRAWLSRRRSNSAPFTIGEEVVLQVANKEGKDVSYVATVSYVDEDEDTVDIAIYGEDVRKFRRTITSVSPSSLKKLSLLYDGSPVWADYKGGGELFPGHISLIWPTGEADIEYDDGDFETAVPPDRYKPRLKTKI